MAPFEGELRAGLSKLGLQADDHKVAQLLEFGQLLQKWTKVYNLTAVRDPHEVLTHHLLDCAAVVAPLRRITGGRPKRLLDVGSGGGLPGAVVAVMCPEIHVDCIDTVAKKAAFIQQVAATLGLPNLRGVHGRVEQVDEAYDVISSRAFASLVDFVSLSRQALGPDGVWLAMKGKYPVAEVAELPRDVELFHVEQLEVPGLEAERCVLWLRRRPA